ncbi:PREDICTED: protein tramtrack, beta isoform-like [Trachymyrmex cornetzi]|uniref:protein tramtrack, beta isoform-like n=1 Tax=Trachymyrmex cornetzi TaxID=471704 RepID=UPI00084F6F58|nr:PREDICTED: protein tramtrack, beta isoform-like [Trachymyrmex cornetzi]
MAVSSERYCIQWNNHQSTLLNFFNNLLYNKMFADITLVLDNNVMVKCHKIVLSAYSTYFRTLFLNLPCEHQTIVLKNIKISEMMPILQFMYQGKTNVIKNQVNDVLKVAKALQVKDLVIEDNNKSRSSTMSDPRREDAINMVTMPLIINIGNNDVAAAHSLLSLHSSVDHLSATQTFHEQR